MNFSNIIHKTWIRFIKHLLDMCFVFKLKIIPFLPISLDIEPTNRCNFKCPHCQSTYWTKEKKDMRMNAFIQIVNQFPFLNRVKLQGIGEPFLNNELTNMLVLLEEKKINTEIISNGSIMSEDFISILPNVKRLSLKYSIDSINGNTLKNIRPGSNIENILANISDVIRLKVENNKKEISIWTVVTQNNIYELTSLLEISKQLKISKIYFQFFLNDWGQNNVKSNNKNIRLNICSDEIRKLIHQLKIYANFLGVHLQIVGNNYLSTNNKCKWPFLSAFIDANGNVVPCCVLSNSDIYSMGNIFEEKFSKIWNSKKYQDLRMSIKKNQLYDFCRPCYRLY